MTWLAFILECDYMLCLHLCCLHCLLYPIMYDFHVIGCILCIFILLMHVSLLVCSCHQALLQILIPCSFMPIYIQGILSPSIGALLVATCVVRNSIQWIYEHQIQTYICPLRTLFSLIACLYIHMLSLFACFLACSLPLLVCSICMFFAIFFLST